MSSPTNSALTAELAALVTGVARPEERREGARALARHLGARDLILFLRDPDAAVLLPAPGFPSTMPGGLEWQQFVRACADTGHAEGHCRILTRAQSCPRSASAMTAGSCWRCWAGRRDARRSTP